MKAEPAAQTGCGTPVPFGHPLLQRTLTAFTYRDFRVLWFGAFTSTVGTWMQKVAQSWLVFDLTKSSFFLGLDDFLGQLPILLFTLVGGVIADRHDRRQLLLGSQYVQMATAFTLAALVFFGHVHIWHILALSSSPDSRRHSAGPPTSRSFPRWCTRKISRTRSRSTRSSSISRASSVRCSPARRCMFGTAACFGLNGLSFVVVIVALMSLHITHIRQPEKKPILQEMKGGIAYARSQPSIIALTVLAFLTTFLGLPLLTFLPVFAREVFHGDVALYTHMMAFSGTGAVVGALVVAWLGRPRRMGVMLLIVQVAFGALVVAFALSRVWWLSCTILFLAGAALIVVFSMTASLVQLIVPDHLRGRVVSIYMVAFRGGMPLGSLAGGYAASLTSAPHVLAVNGALVSVVALYFLVRSDVRHL